MSKTFSRSEEAFSSKLFIIDPLQGYLGSDVDMHRANEVRPILSKIGKLAEKYECTFIFIMHLNKSMGGKGIYRMMGSIDVPAASCSILLVGSDPNNENGRAIVHIKSSLAPKDLWC